MNTDFQNSSITGLGPIIRSFGDIVTWAYADILPHWYKYYLHIGSSYNNQAVEFNECIDQHTGGV